MGIVRPISPNEVLRKKGGQIPSIVYEVFNELIAATFIGKSAIVYQEDVVQRLVIRGEVRDEIYSKHWLDIEEEYEKVGWKVKYDKPGYNETGRPFYIFTMDKEK